MAITLRDIAERVGKSVTTVSRALAGYDDVSEATREQVRQVALELGYEPNIVARQLQKRRTDTLALILPTYGPRFSDPFFSEFLAGVGNEADRRPITLQVPAPSRFSVTCRVNVLTGLTDETTNWKVCAYDLLAGHSHPHHMLAYHGTIDDHCPRRSEGTSECERFRNRSRR